jgi:hypothetical protein
VENVLPKMEKADVYQLIFSTLTLFEEHSYHKKTDVSLMNEFSIINVHANRIFKFTRAKPIENIDETEKIVSNS